MTRREAPRRCGCSGMTLIELCVVIAILGVLFTLGVASLKRARVAADETDAIGALRTITKAEFAYAVNCGRGNYAISLVVLGSKPPGVVQGFLNEDLGGADTVTTEGYRITLREGVGSSTTLPDCQGNDTHTRYYALAIPLAEGTSGRRSFATTQNGAIWQRLGMVPPPEPFGPPSEPAH